VHKLTDSDFISLGSIIGWLLLVSHLDHRSDMLLSGEVFEITGARRWLVLSCAFTA